MSRAATVSHSSLPIVIGALKSIILYANGNLFNTASHWLDCALRLNSDHRAVAIQGYLPNSDGLLEGDRLINDPVGQGTIWFENGVTCYALNTPRGSDACGWRVALGGFAVVSDT